MSPGIRRHEERRAGPRPLAGRRILVTRPGHQNRMLCGRLRRLGAQAFAVPSIAIEPPRPGGPLDDALRRIARYDWVIVTSANGARAVVERARALRMDLASIRTVRWAAVGPATARTLRAAGIVVAAMPMRFVTEAIPQALRDVAGARVLLPRTDAAPPALAQMLRQRGAVVEEVAAYRTVLAPAASRARARRLIAGRRVDTVIFTSASTVRGLMRLLGPERRALGALEIACIGPVTAAAVVEEGFAPTVVATEHTTQGLLDALVSHARRTQRGAHDARDRAAR
ncbi:MAG: uroporphyrinogen-III synthase [Armatimonadota bacterium]|nr:uroporphyrinogen-III synthase [Armatimonadota bacterium]MDR7519473.1 uroporphyrinogen-III synthase [Armatimonadota bacterium]MDR7549170.1 uroporphyrinogen-III synthase [Armatimonadota bacterium]